MRVLRRAASLPEAKAIEAAMIAKHQPPRNVQYSSKSDGQFTLVKTMRPNGMGEMVPVTARIRTWQMP
jgi:hypothetical protein